MFLLLWQDILDTLFLILSCWKDGDFSVCEQGRRLEDLRSGVRLYGPAGSTDKGVCRSVTYIIFILNLETNISFDLGCNVIFLVKIHFEEKNPAL